MDSTWFNSTFLSFLKFPHIKEGGDLISWEAPICRTTKLFRPPFCISISEIWRIQLLAFHQISMHSTWFSSTFLSSLKFPKIKKGGCNFLEGTNSAEWLNYLVPPLLYLNFRNLKDPNCSSIRFQWVLHYSAVLFSIFWNFLKWKRGELISWGEPILQNVYNTLSRVLTESNSFYMIYASLLIWANKRSSEGS